MFDIQSEVKSFLTALPVKPQRILLGVSGGLDSMVLLYVLAKLRSELGFELLVSHIDHGIREDSKDDLKLIESTCKDMQVQCFAKRLTPPTSNLEAWGREERYKYFFELLSKNNCDYLATAHHKDDLVETFLFRLLTGRFNSLSQPIKALDDGRRLIRPLINMTKEQILEYSRLNFIAFNEDSTNVDQVYRRNFIRHSISPVLKKFESKWDDHICDYMEVVGDLEQFVYQEAKKHIGCSLEAKQNIPNVLLQRVLYLECAEIFSEDAFKISRDRIMDLIGLIKNPQEHKRECDLGFGLYVVLDRVGAENATLRFHKREFDLKSRQIQRVTETEFSFEFGRGLRGRLQLFSKKEDCENSSKHAPKHLYASAHAFPIKNMADLECEFIETGERVDVGPGRTRVISKIYKDEKWNEERRTCSVLLRKEGQSYLLGSRFYPLESSSLGDDYIYSLFSISRV